MKRYLFLLLFCSGYLFAQVGVIDPLQVQHVLPGYSVLIESYAKRSKQQLDSQQIFISRYSSCLERSYMLDSLHAFALDDSIKFHQDNMVAFQLRSDKIMKQMEMEMRTALDKELQLRVREFCEKNKLAALFDRKGILYCPGCKDYTAELIKFLKK
ncbi:MAG: hypothetical protein IT233_10805 [Bacteroidia bacterium]|nr:hypothetical protein [Bacteroidia bacterium]